MKILITGSSGMMGSRLFESLLDTGYDVIGVDRRSNKWNPSLNEKTINTNLLNQKELDKMSKDVDMMIHLAANARVYELIKNPYLAMENIITTFNIMEFARKNNISRIVFSSSREVYGNITDDRSISEEERLGNCESPYSASKISAEALIHSYNKNYGIDFVIARFSNVYGMYDDSDRVIPLWIKKVLKNEELIVFGEGKSLDFNYIDDAIQGTVKIIEKFDSVKGEVFNIASRESTKLVFVANKIKETLESKSKISIKENRKGEILKFKADISKAGELLGYRPKVNIETGLDKTLRWYKEFYR